AAAALDALYIALGHVGRGAGDAGVDEQQMRTQFGEPPWRQDQWARLDFAIGLEAQVTEAAVGRHRLILRTDGFLQHVLLNVDRFAGKLLLGGHLAAERVQGVQQADGESGTGSHAAAGGQVAVVVKFDAAFDLQEAERFTDGRVSNLFDRLAGLDFAINDAEAMFEERRQVAAGEIAVFIDGGGENRAAVVAIPAGVIGAAAEERQAIRGPADDHSMIPGAGLRGRAGAPAKNPWTGRFPESGPACQAGLSPSNRVVPRRTKVAPSSTAIS